MNNTNALKTTLTAALSLVSLAATAAPIVFPSDAGVIDVTKAPYNAIPNDGKDDTAAIQAALDRYPSQNRIIFLPPGEYLISDTLTWPQGKNEGGREKRTILQGAGMDYTTIRLINNAPGFEKPKVDKRYKRPSGKGMMHTGTAPAQRFRNGVRDITLNSGKGNAGACGLQYCSNNQGTVANVRIISGDGDGVIGLDLGYAMEQGPCLIKNVSVEGFDYGAYAFGHVNSITMVNFSTSNQNKAGLLNDNQVFSIENFKSQQNKNVPSLINARGDGIITLIGATVNTPIQNKGTLYARMHDGSERIEGGKITLDKTNKNPISLKLPVRPTPEPRQDPLSQWVSPLEFGGNSRDTADDTAAIQKAIDSGRSTLYLPNGTWMMNGDIFIRGNIQRVIGCETAIKGKGRIRIVDGNAPVVVFERIEVQYAPISISHESKRTLVLSACVLHRDHGYSSKNGGDVFIEDVSAAPFHFSNQNVWARQINPELKTTKITATGGNLWILGLKTEGTGSAIEMNGGNAEIAGAFIYSNTGDPKPPLYILNNNAQLSATMGEFVLRKQPHKVIVEENTPSGQRTLNLGETPRRSGGSCFALFSTQAAK